MSSHVTIQSVDALQLAAIHDEATFKDLAAKIGRHVGTLLKYFQDSKTTFGRCVVIYGEGGTCSSAFPIDVGWEVDSPFAGDGVSIKHVTTPVGMAASVTHIGPYDQLHSAHQLVRELCKGNGHLITGPNWEVYDHPHDDEPPRVDVFYLLQ